MSTEAEKRDVETFADSDESGDAPKLKRNRSVYTLLFQLQAMFAIPYGEGAPLISAIYGGGQLTIFVGWIVTLMLHETVALSLAELASLYPTASGPYYWTFQMLQNPKPSTASDINKPVGASEPKRVAVTLSYMSGWLVLAGNWIIALSVNFGFAQFLSAIISIYIEGYTVSAWAQLLIFYLMCLLTLAMLIFGNKVLPMLDSIATAWNVMALIVIMIALSVSADSGRHSVKDTLGYYDDSLSGWGGFSFFIGMLPPSYTFAAMGLICSMAEEVQKPRTQVPTVLGISIPIACVVGLTFIIPICATLPPLEDIMLAPGGQALPYIFDRVMKNMAGSLALNIIVLVIVLFCTVAVSLTASRYTWAFARDGALPGSSIFSKIHPKYGVPVNALLLMTAVEMLLGLISLGNATAFNAFVSCSTIAMEVSYAIPIGISMWNRRTHVAHAEWKLPNVIGWTVNTIAMFWIAFECFLFSLPVTRPLADASLMNYASVVLVGIAVLVAIWFIIRGRKIFKGPPAQKFD